MPFSLNPILIPINKNSIYEILANANQIVRADFVSTDAAVFLSALHEDEHGNDCHSPRDRVVFHCHNLEHEDGGMMLNYEIQ